MMKIGPVGFKGGVNTYAYTEANPVMKKDEMGLWASVNYGGYSPYVQNMSMSLHIWIWTI